MLLRNDTLELMLHGGRHTDDHVRQRMDTETARRRQLVLLRQSTQDEGTWSWITGCASYPVSLCVCVCVGVSA